jgi:hypothetical protein
MMYDSDEVRYPALKRFREPVRMIHDADSYLDVGS